MKGTVVFSAVTAIIGCVLFGCVEDSQNLTEIGRTQQTKKSFVAVHDYETGAVMVRIFARNEDEVAAILPAPEWEIVTDAELISRGVAGLDSLRESDIDAKEQWLKELVDRDAWRRKMEAQGKHWIPYYGKRNGETVYREIWARSVAEVRREYPDLIPMYHMTLTPEIFDQMDRSDIDNPDEFLDSFRGNL